MRWNGKRVENKPLQTSDLSRVVVVMAVVIAVPRTGQYSNNTHRSGSIGRKGDQVIPRLMNMKPIIIRNAVGFALVASARFGPLAPPVSHLAGEGLTVNL